MIYEVRTYKLKVGTHGEFIKHFGEAYEHRKKYSELAAFFYTEIGRLNEVIHIWPYENAGERERIRAEANKDPHWPPAAIMPFIVDMESEIFFPFPFTPEFPKGELGPIFEYRSYILRPGTMPDTIESWSKAVPDRIKLSPLAMTMYSENGHLNKLVHVWPYKTLNERLDTRTKAVEMGIWPPKGGAARIEEQNSKICLAAPFSPLH